MKRVSADRYSTNEVITLNLNTECASWTQAGHTSKDRDFLDTGRFPRTRTYVVFLRTRELEGVLGVCDVCDVCGSEKVRILFFISWMHDVCDERHGPWSVIDDTTNEQVCKVF